MTVRTLTVGYLYPEIMSGYGDHGNLAAIVRRCGWRGIATDVRKLRLGDPVDPDEVDLFVIGNGGEFHQRLIATDLADVKGPGICEAVGEGAALLAVGAGYELLGRFYQPSRGVELPGARLFDTWTIQQGADLTTASCTIAEAGAGRAIGDLLVRWDGAGPGGPPAGSDGDHLLVGFENHSARTYLGPAARALGQVVAGRGNNGDGSEGVRLGSAIGTYLRGPCLPRNPVLADFLIRAALRRRYGEAELAPLPDQIEHAARDTAVRRLRRTLRAGARGRPVRAAARLPTLLPVQARKRLGHEPSDRLPGDGTGARSAGQGQPRTVGAWTTRRSSATSTSSSRPSMSCAPSWPPVSCPVARSGPG
jgi:lipid II isoglutaminyl synthase (glutamine-hydrolysing)